MQSKMGQEAAGAAEIVAANMHKAEGEASNANVGKTMDKMGVSKAADGADGAKPGGGCCSVQ